MKVIQNSYKKANGEVVNEQLLETTAVIGDVLPVAGKQGQFLRESPNGGTYVSYAAKADFDGEKADVLVSISSKLACEWDEDADAPKEVDGKLVFNEQFAKGTSHNMGLKVVAGKNGDIAVGRIMLGMNLNSTADKVKAKMAALKAASEKQAAEQTASVDA